MIKIDFKKTNKELYAPSKKEPTVIDIPTLNYIMVDGNGNPNDSDGEYPLAVELLYALSYTIKMSNKKNFIEDDNVYDYVVPPLEGLWWLNDQSDMDFTQKQKYCWTSMIQPEFVTEQLLEQAKSEILRKKPSLDVSKARLESYTEGLCVQMMHIGPYDAEPATIAKINTYMKENHLFNDFGTLLPNGKTRRHHEVYLSDPRKANPSTMQTILRHPVKY